MDNVLDKATIVVAANELNENWREAYFAQNGESAERWKPMKPESVA